MDILQKCYDYDKPDVYKKKGLYPFFRPLNGNEGPIVIIDGRKIIMAGSNNYLGLTTHPRVKGAAEEALLKYGTGCSGSRYMTGTLDLHIQLEDRIAKFLGYEAALLFSTGFQTSIGVIATLPGKGDYIVSDKENHACIIQAALLAKGITSEFVRYKHNDMEDLDKLLGSLPSGPGKLIVSDGVFSVTGEIVNLPDMVKVAKKHGARVLIDDAHAIGVIGVGGRGTASNFGLESEVDLVIGTFSKTFASLGGFVAADERVINYIKHNSAAIIFSASPTPSSCAAALAALDILEEQPQLVDKLIDNADYMRSGLKNLGFNVCASQTAIISILIGDDFNTILLWKKLFDFGVFTNAFIPPGVPPNMSMIRTSYMASHEREHLDQILDVFKTAGKELGMI
ncbi:MAG: 8-amino-7-oxononanoate synthase [Bacteroidota bacterium]|nr:8-amino-7-oxononanoate synthase [Bacteroidota bacterium]